MDQDLYGGGEAGERTDGVKVRFDLGPDLPLRSEGMWARRIARDTFLVTNIPFFAVGVSYLDVVRAEHAEDGRLWAGGGCSAPGT